jgi:hypothetical protein
MTFRTPILAAALFTGVAALGLSHATGHAAPAPANPGAMPTDTGHHPAESRNGRPGSTINLESDGDGGIPFCPPTKNGHINPPPVPWNKRYGHAQM